MAKYKLLQSNWIYICILKLMSTWLMSVFQIYVKSVCSVFHSIFLDMFLIFSKAWILCFQFYENVLK